MTTMLFRDIFRPEEAENTIEEAESTAEEGHNTAKEGENITKEGDNTMLRVYSKRIRG
jgi:hypothetical protein